MTVCFSKLGTKLTAHTGIMELMDDLGRALASSDDMVMMGGGNPAALPAVQQLWQGRMREILAQPAEFDRMLLHYDPPQGNPGFTEALAGCLRRTFGWDVGPANIAVTAGGQAACFMLFNMLAGTMPDGSFRKVLMPLMPEYIGYADQGLGHDLFVGHRPTLEHIDRHVFKYHVDFEGLRCTPDIGAVCVSRPTNPTGNVLTDSEIHRLAGLAEAHGVPLIIDGAYGAPFPQILFRDANPIWNPNIILTLSLSKLGLPGTRTGIVVAREAIASAIACMNAVIGLANPNVGQVIIRPLLESGELLRISHDLIRPFYMEKSRLAREWIAAAFPDDLPYHVHLSEGAIFLWLWFKDLPITTRTLYERLKRRGVLVVPGAYFFYGLAEPWPQQNECIRLNFSQPHATVRRGIEILAEEVRAAYA